MKKHATLIVTLLFSAFFLIMLTRNSGLKKGSTFGFATVEYYNPETHYKDMYYNAEVYIKDKKVVKIMFENGDSLCGFPPAPFNKQYVAYITDKNGIEYTVTLDENEDYYGD